MDECKGIAGWLFGHRFEVMKDRHPPEGVKTKGFLMFPDDHLKLIEGLTKYEVRGIYCPRCGARKELEKERS